MYRNIFETGDTLIWKRIFFMRRIRKILTNTSIVNQYINLELPRLRMRKVILGCSNQMSRTILITHISLNDKGVNSMLGFQVFG